MCQFDLSLIHNISKIEQVIQGRKIETRDRVGCFTKIARNIRSYVFVKGWQAFVRYRGQIQTCRICGDIDHHAKDCPRAKRQNKPSQPSNPDTPMETQEIPKPPEPVISQEEIMNTPGESAQGSPLISQPNSEDSDEHIPKPNPSPEEMASTLNLKDTLQSIFGSEYSATSEVEDIRSVASQSEKSLPSPLSSEENVQNATEAKDTEGPGDCSQMSWGGKMDKKAGIKTYCP